MFDLVCETLGINDRQRAVMIGDNLQSDILGGNLAHIDTIWYNFGLATRNDEIVPTYEASNYEQLVVVIEGEK
jgi:Predicted hydrolase (HAD superfamily)